MGSMVAPYLGHELRYIIADDYVALERHGLHSHAERGNENEELTAEVAEVAEEHRGGRLW